MTNFPAASSILTSSWVTWLPHHDIPLLNNSLDIWHLPQRRIWRHVQDSVDTSDWEVGGMGAGGGGVMACWGGTVLLRYSNKWPHQDAQRVANALPLSGLDAPTHSSTTHYPGTTYWQNKNPGASFHSVTTWSRSRHFWHKCGGC